MVTQALSETLCLEGVLEGPTLESRCKLSFIYTTKDWWVQGSVVGKTKRHSEVQSRRYEEYKASMKKTTANSWTGLADS